MPLADRWTTREQAERHWADAKTLTDATLDELLAAAEESCLTYGPALADPLPTPMPVRWVLASIYQAREIRAAGLREGDVIGVGDYAIRARPLTSAVRQLLRPMSGNTFTVA